MKRLVVKTILSMVGEVLLIAIIAGIGIGVIGKINQWQTSLEYSNGFFLAGCLVIVAGTASRLGARNEAYQFRLFDAESFRGMSSNDRVNYIIEVSSSVRVVILGVASGLLLILISVIAAKAF